MMLAHPQLDTVFDFDLHYINSIVIENQAFLRDFLRDIYYQINGCRGKTVLSCNDKPVTFQGNAEIIDEFLSFDISRKSLITKLISRIENIALDVNHYMQTSELIGNLECYIEELSFDLPCNIYCSKMNFGVLLKAVGICIQEDYDNDLERILDYMELTRELENNKLFILVNMRSYYSDTEIEVFFDSLLNHDHRIFLVDSSSHKLLQNEHRITIDNDLCEF